MKQCLKSSYLAEQAERMLGFTVDTLYAIRQEPRIDDAARQKIEGPLKLALHFATKTLCLAHGLNIGHQEATEQIMAQGSPALAAWKQELAAEVDWAYPRCSRGHEMDYLYDYCGRCGAGRGSVTAPGCQRRVAK